MMHPSVKAGEEAVGADGLLSKLWWSRKGRKKKAPGKKKTEVLQLCPTMLDRRKRGTYPPAKAESRTHKELR